MSDVKPLGVMGFSWKPQDNATSENLRKLAHLIAMGQPLQAQAVSEAIVLCAEAWEQAVRQVEALVHVTALSMHEEDCFATYGPGGKGLVYLTDDLFSERCECGVTESLRNLLDAETIEAVKQKRAALAMLDTEAMEAAKRRHAHREPGEEP